MTIRVTPETERLVQGVRAWWHRNQLEGGLDASPEVRRRAVERIRELRKGVRMERDGVTLREFAHLGHRYSVSPGFSMLRLACLGATRMNRPLFPMSFSIGQRLVACFKCRRATYATARRTRQRIS